MKIGIDLDNSLIEVDHVWATYFNLYSEGHGHGRPYDPECVEYSQARDICDACYDICRMDPGLLLACPLMPGAKGALWGLSAEHDLYVISARHPSLRGAVRDLLERRGVLSTLCGIHLGCAAKAETCRALKLDALLDDAPGVSEEMAECLGTRLVLMDRPYNRSLPGSRAYTWMDLFARVIPRLERAA